MRTGLRALVMLATILVAAAAHAASEDTAISNMLMRMFDKPEARLTVGPVVISGDHAVADWAQGDMGGRALLRRQHDQWNIVLCAGDQIKTQDAMIKAGVPAPDASRLALDLANAEARLEPEQRARFSRFEGLVMMEHDSKHH